MGSVMSSAANDVSTLVGNVVSTPFKILFGASCETNLVTVIQKEKQERIMIFMKNAECRVTDCIPLDRLQAANVFPQHGGGIHAGCSKAAKHAQGPHIWDHCRHLRATSGSIWMFACSKVRKRDVKQVNALQRQLSRHLFFL
ncbi:hypothetical protein C2845_PM11G17470 [Panicum miliaceum]|uniref:Uncharacterized protein n=1 Tax=Panicum miliaceum TaxID=4540 RepID=A0A3L6RR52_PANMI|nr:hypothetical protein C2845_PM11G17470 [Panicum miliaceum]